MPRAMAASRCPLPTELMPARQVERLLEAGGTRNLSARRGRVRFYTSGDAAAVESLLPKLLGESGKVERLVWTGESPGVLRRPDL
ncbi:MAG: hypothetical protein QY329_05750 [Anaerolineales bacterium]|nr:MAG: hypothetical protein QY329_05750 [Anaerolineales bacterium]